MSSDLHQQFVRDMLTESFEGLDRYDRSILLLEQGQADREMLNDIFRVIHSLKGTAGCLGFQRIQRVAHVGENLLDLLRSGSLQPSADIAGGLLRLSDALRVHLDAIDASGVESDEDQAEIIELMQALKEGKATKRTVRKGKKAAEPAVSAAVPAPATVAAVSSEPAAAWGLFDDAPAPAAPVVAETAAPAGAWGLFDDPAPAAPASDAGPAEVASAVETAPVAVALMSDVGAGPVAGAPVGAGAAGATVRVDVGLLDRLMNLVGELVLTRNQLVQLAQSKKTRSESVTDVSQRLNLITSELQEGMMKTRMQPIGTVWGKFPRIVRDIAHNLGKQVRLDTFGTDTELDRTIIEAIRDPLTHIVRNSIDHGIEMPEKRVAAGKPAEGTLMMRAFHEGGQVNIEIIDDGAGINLERVRQRALERGLIKEPEAGRMSERELTNLIFAPGFSTAEKVTDVSGRGVGMDVVRTNIEKIGGSVDVQSTAGQGTTLKIKIPLTLAIIPALVVRAGGQRFAIPQVNLLELVRLDGEAARAALEHVCDAPVFRLRGQLLPLVFLKRELALADAGQPGNALNIVVLQADSRHFGLVVDGVCDSEEIVVKPLSKQLKSVSVYAGATIMGDGRVALILDVFGLAQRAQVVAENRATPTKSAADAAAEKRDIRQLLVFSAAGRERLALPLDDAARLEEISPERIERSGTREAVQYRGRIMPLVRLSRLLPGGQGAVPVQATDALQVIVYQQADRTVGLVVDEIRDIVEDQVHLEAGSAGPGILGSAVIQGRITDLVDVPAILRAADRAA